VWLAYRLRQPAGEGREDVVVVATSQDGERFTTVATVAGQRLGAGALQRPALIRRPDGGWRLYVSRRTPGSLHWCVEALDAAIPSELGSAPRRMVLPGDRDLAVKDPVVRWAGGGWEMWVCCQPIEDPAEADRMETRYATSRDGLRWTLHGTALAGRPGHWDERAARVTAVLSTGPRTVAYYDGRASATDRQRERTGLAVGTGPERLAALGTAPVTRSTHGRAALRYLSVVVLPDGGHRLYYEAERPDGAHELRTEYAPPPPPAPAFAPTIPTPVVPPPPRR
jgi:hypothetical protein